MQAPGRLIDHNVRGLLVPAKAILNNLLLLVDLFECRRSKEQDAERVSHEVNLQRAIFHEEAHEAGRARAWRETENSKREREEGRETERERKDWYWSAASRISTAVKPDDNRIAGDIAHRLGQPEIQIGAFR